MRCRDVIFSITMVTTLFVLIVCSALHIIYDCWKVIRRLYKQPIHECIILCQETIFNPKTNYSVWSVTLASVNSFIQFWYKTYWSTKTTNHMLMFLCNDKPIYHVSWNLIRYAFTPLRKPWSNFIKSPTIVRQHINNNVYF